MLPFRRKKQTFLFDETVTNNLFSVGVIVFYYFVYIHHFYASNVCQKLSITLMLCLHWERNKEPRYTIEYFEVLEP